MTEEKLFRNLDLHNQQILNKIDDVLRVFAAIKSDRKKSRRQIQSKNPWLK